MSYDNIPDELKALRQWICWRYDIRNGRRTKVPVNPKSKSAKPASTIDPETWGPFELAVKRSGLSGNGIVPVDGIGFVFTKDDPYIGIDIDSDFDDDAMNVLDIVERIGSYAEWSPSGEGIHVICKGSIPTTRSGKHPKGIGVFQHSRFFTMTGKVFNVGQILHRNR